MKALPAPETHPRDGERPDSSGATGAGDCLVSFLAGIAPFDQFDEGSLGRLAAHLEPVRLAAGERLCSAGAPARVLWLIREGSLEVQSGHGPRRRVEGRVVGEEAALGAACYLQDISAVSPSNLLGLRVDLLPAPESPRTQDLFGRSLIASYLDQPGPAGWRDLAPPPARPDPSPLSPWIGWPVALMVPALVLLWSGEHGLNWSQRHLLAALAAGAILWALRLVPPYAAALFSLLVCLVLGVVPPAVCLSGFASQSFFMTMSLFVIGAVLVKSGLVRRVFLWALARMQHSRIGPELVFAGGSLVLSQVVLSSHDRLRVMAFLLKDGLRDLAATSPQQVQRTTLAAFMGSAFFGPVFLTGGALNLLLYGMMPEQVQFHYSWLRWLLAAGVPFLFMAAAFTLLVLREIPSRGRPLRPQVERVSLQLRSLGRLTYKKWLILLGAGAVLGAMILSPLHKIDHRLIGLTALAGFLVLDLLDRDQISRDIDWSFLLLLGSMVGLIHTFSYNQTAFVFFDGLGNGKNLFAHHHVMLTWLLVGAALAIKPWLPRSAVWLALPALALANIAGMNAWVVAFSLLLVDGFPPLTGADERLVIFRSTLGENDWCPPSLDGRLMRAALLIGFLTILLSIPYWQYLNLL